MAYPFQEPRFLHVAFLVHPSLVSVAIQSLMPAKSKKQQMAAGAALSVKRGKRSKSSLKGASRKMANSMNESELRDLAKTKRKPLPVKSKINAARWGRF